MFDHQKSKAHKLTNYIMDRTWGESEIINQWRKHMSERERTVRLG